MGLLDRLGQRSVGLRLVEASGHRSRGSSRSRGYRLVAKATGRRFVAGEPRRGVNGSVSVHGVAVVRSMSPSAIAVGMVTGSVGIR